MRAFDSSGFAATLRWIPWGALSAGFAAVALVLLLSGRQPAQA